LPTANPTQQDPHGPEDDIFSEPSIILIWTYQDMMEWMSRLLVGEMAGADGDFGLEVFFVLVISKKYCHDAFNFTFKFKCTKSPHL
jgi:hypothetical protein